MYLSNVILLQEKVVCFSIKYKSCSVLRMHEFWDTLYIDAVVQFNAKLLLKFREIVFQKKYISNVTREIKLNKMLFT